MAKRIAGEQRQQIAETEAAISGYRQRVDQSRLRVRRTEIEVAALKRDLAALDYTLQFHEILIDPEEFSHNLKRLRK